MNAVAPTMLSSSKVPQPEFACWWPSSPSAASSAAYSARFSPFMIRCCQSMLTLTLSMPAVAQLVDHVQRHPDVRHVDLHRRLGVLVLEEEQAPVRREPLGDLRDAVDQPRPRSRRTAPGTGSCSPRRRARRSSARRSRRRGRPPRAEPSASRAHRVVERGQPALAEARVDVQARRRSRRSRARRAPRAPRRGCRGSSSPRIVELVVVHQVAEPGDRAVHLLRDRLVRAPAGSRRGRSA